MLSGPTVITTLSISVCWMVYNMVPPFLLIHYAFVGRGATLAFWSRCPPRSRPLPVRVCTPQVAAALQLPPQACNSPAADLEVPACCVSPACMCARSMQYWIA